MSCRRCSTQRSDTSGVSVSKSEGSQFDKQHSELQLVLGELHVTLHNMARQVDYVGDHHVTKNGPFMTEAKRALELLPLVQAALSVAPSAEQRSITYTGVAEAIARLRLASFTTHAGFPATPLLMVEAEMLRLSPQSAKEEIKAHYHRGGLSAEKCPLCRDAERLSWLNLHWEQIEYGGGDLGKLRELIDAAMHATVGPTVDKA
jgi:hypothetical protein